MTPQALDARADESGATLVQRPRRPIIVAVEALYVVLLLPLGFVFTGTLPFHQLQLVAIGLVGTVGWAAIIRRPTSLPVVVVLGPLPLLASALLTAIVSPYPSLSWTAAWQVAAYVGIFWLLALQASSPAGRRELIDALAIVLIVAIGMYLLAVVTAWREWLALGFDIRTLPLRPLDSGGLALLPTWLSDLVALLTPMIVAVLWSHRARVAAIVLSAVAFGTILLAETRSVLLLVLAVCTVAALLAVRKRSGRKSVGIVIAATIAIGIVALVVVLGSSRSFDEGRSSAYASAISRFAESPLVGGGPGTYGVRRMSDPVDTFELLTFPDAHNVVLTAAAESGVVGLGAMLLMAGLLFTAIRRAWVTSTDRLVMAGALIGLAILLGHSMVDVVIGLVGVVVSAVAVLALAVTGGTPEMPRTTAPSPYLRFGLLGAGVLLIAVTGLVIRTESSYATIAGADGSQGAGALSRVTAVTGMQSDMVPAWWSQMLAADATGDANGAIAAANKLTTLEGFGQEWMQLGVLASRAGDTATARDAITRATDVPMTDPLVQLNAVVLLDAMGDQVGATAAARRLLESQPDIEPVLAGGPPALARLVESVRNEQAHAALAAGDPDKSFVTALSGEDRRLAEALLATVAAGDPGAGADYRDVVDAWFGSVEARDRLETGAQADPSQHRLVWAWRVAAHACDSAAVDRWARALEISNGPAAMMPTALEVAPAFDGRLLPSRYPTFVWRLEYPIARYVNGTWAYTLGRSACGPVAGS